MEIVNTKEEDVNEKTHDVRLKGRTIHLSDRCFELLSWVHSLNKVSSSKKVYVATSYHDSYFKFVMTWHNTEGPPRKVHCVMPFKI